MRKYSKTKHAFPLVIIFVVCLPACSTMTLNSFPTPVESAYRESTEIKGISALAQPLLTKKESEKYFGVDLLNSEILAVHLSVKNNIPDTSFILPADSIHLVEAVGKGALGNPESGDENIAEVAAVVGTILLSPLLIAVAVQQGSDVTIIKENFERKKLRTTTIEFKQSVHGFSYFPIAKDTLSEVVDVCFKLIDSLNDKSIPICIRANLKE